MYIYKLWFQLELELIRLICLPLCIFVLQLVRAWIDQTYLFTILYICLTTRAWIDHLFVCHCVHFSYNLCLNWSDLFVCDFINLSYNLCSSWQYLHGVWTCWGWVADQKGNPHHCQTHMPPQTLPCGPPDPECWKSSHPLHPSHCQHEMMLIILIIISNIIKFTN